MKSPSRWLLALAMAGLVTASIVSTRAWLSVDVHERLELRYRSRLGSLSESQASLLVRRMGQHGEQWLDLLVAASADERRAVAAAAELELRELVDRWAELPEENSPHVADLARLLATQVTELPPERRHLAHSLARRLLDWPVDIQLVNAAKLIADCQTVLLLPRVEPVQIRVAAPIDL